MRRPPSNFCSMCRPSWRGLHKVNKPNKLDVKLQFGAACPETPDCPKWLLRIKRTIKKRLWKKTKLEWGARSHAADDKATEDSARKRELPQSPCPATVDDSQEQLESACIAHGMSGVVCPESDVPCDGEEHPQLHIDELALIGLGSHCDGTGACSQEKDVPWKLELGDLIFGQMLYITEKASRTDACFVIGAALNLLNQASRRRWHLSGPPQGFLPDVLAAAFLSCAVVLQIPEDGYAFKSGMVVDDLLRCMRGLAGKNT